ncbi:DUF4138 domain-containing protein [Antarcticibacterium flavum]|uniref:DUF4138 domain-containing protein n=1 Tax=Antarcticibacterium flavum TaxID=2058175 RepID=A0A5B7X6F6_9FLAO|nr:MULTISPECIES: DUF4138 domain-containing protein [Antarcticibacterium]MCM4158447.1 conjugal transfer protein TraN [Antarcticibacterium sp. W02-3]QCY70203.1 DUF4138 domain-containing protein [Antarcticibacterium flavum]
MKTLMQFLALSIFAAVPPCLAQESKTLDTIFANDQKNVALFFPDPIRQGITGSDNFVFTYNRESQQHFGLLQAKPGKESNLLVVSTNGSVFSYIVKYKEQLNQLNYFISATTKIGIEKPDSNSGLEIREEKIEKNDKIFYYNKFCSYLAESKQHIGGLKKRKQDIILSVENIVFDKEELYFVIQIENKSSLDYDLNFLKFGIETRPKGKKKSSQTIYQEPVFKYNLPTRIKENGTEKLVYVFPKFSLGDDHRVILEVNERNGGRNVRLKVPHKFVNNPN